MTWTAEQDCGGSGSSFRAGSDMARAHKLDAKARTVYCFLCKRTLKVRMHPFSAGCYMVPRHKRVKL